MGLNKWEYFFGLRKGQMWKFVCTVYFFVQVRCGHHQKLKAQTVEFFIQTYKRGGPNRR